MDEEFKKNIQSIWLNIENKTNKNKIIIYFQIFKGYGFLYCYTTKELNELKQLYGENINPINFITSLNLEIQVYSERKDINQINIKIEEILIKDDLESIMYQKAYHTYLNNRLKNEDNNDNKKLIQKIILSHPILKLNKFSQNQLNQYILRENEKYVDSSIEEYIKRNQKTIIKYLTQIFNSEKEIKINKKIIKEIKRIKKN